INAVAQPAMPFPNGEREGTRVVNIALAGVSPRLRIATKVLTNAGLDVVVIRIQRSRMPAMVHLEDRTEFWIRRDRQRGRMSQPEIVAMANAGQEETRNREGFLERRIEHNKSGGGVVTGVPVGVLLAATPQTLSDDAISIENRDIQGIMRQPSPIRDTIIEGVTPVPSLDGLEGRLQTNPNYRFEIHRNGHMEVYLAHAAEIAATTKKPFFDHGPGGKRIEGVHTVLDGAILVRSIVEFVRRARSLHDAALIFEPFILTLVLYNSSLSALPAGAVATEEGSIIRNLGTVRHESHLIIGVPGFPDETPGRPAKLLCDRLWQAYGKWKCTALDDNGNLT
ncbi:MAG TPA: hypothetical protein VFP86_00670, partial [bacterium]|nr:hypothetical protein [bacterium]